MAIMNAAARAAAAAAEKAKAKAPVANQKPAGGLLGAAAQTVANEVGKATAAKAAAAKSLPPNMPMPSRTVRDPRAVASGGSAGTGPKTLGPGRTMPNLGNDVRTNGFQVMPEGAVPGRPLPKPVSPSSISAATGPMTPVRGGGMAPASVATMMKKGGRVKAKAKSSYSSGGNVGSASKRADGCAQRGKTKGKVI